MSLTDRDRKIVMILAPLMLLIGYWFVVLAPQREKSTTVEQELTKARGERDTAQAQIGQLNAAKASFASDYQTVIRMGKAIPETVDMPSLLVQLDRAARGTGISMNDIQVAPGEQVTAPSAGTPPGGGGPGAGGSGAQSMPGKAAQGAGNAVNQANGASQANAGAAGSPAGTPAGAPAGTPTPGLSTVGLKFKLVGDFFDMADFFHRMKRFVRVANEQIVVRGRLISVDNWTFKIRPDGKVDADVGATVYLSPKAQGGVSAGASPTGPGPAPSGGSVAADPASQSPSPSAPTASATP